MIIYLLVLFIVLLLVYFYETGVLFGNKESFESQEEIELASQLRIAPDQTQPNLTNQPIQTMSDPNQTQPNQTRKHVPKMSHSTLSMSQKPRSAVVSVVPSEETHFEVPLSESQASTYNPDLNAPVYNPNVNDLMSGAPNSGASGSSGASATGQPEMKTQVVSEESSPKRDIAELKKYLAGVDTLQNNQNNGQPSGQGACATDADCNIVYGNGANKCVNSVCKCTVGTGRFCHVMPNYYKELSQMTPAEIIKFKKTADLEKMALGDYKNWLRLWQYDIENLPQIHLGNFNKLMQGQEVYEIPLSDPVDDFFASQAARKDTICMTIPNAEVDSPLNWKIHSDFNNNAEIGSGSSTEKNLNWARYFNQPSATSDEPLVRNDSITAKNWFLNNVNWMFTDADRNNAFLNPDKNRFINVINSPNTSVAEKIYGVTPTMSEHS